MCNTKIAALTHRLLHCTVQWWLSVCWGFPSTLWLGFCTFPASRVTPVNIDEDSNACAQLIIIIIIIAFKGAIQDFLQSPHSAANCLQHIRSSGPGAIVCKSRATHRAHITCNCHVTCHLVRRDSSAIKLDRVEIAFIWALFYWLNHYTDVPIPASPEYKQYWKQTSHIILCFLLQHICVCCMVFRLSEESFLFKDLEQHHTKLTLQNWPSH